MKKFKASAKRAYRFPEKGFAVGPGLVPSAAIENQYRKEIYELILAIVWESAPLKPTVGGDAKRRQPPPTKPTRGSLTAGAAAFNRQARRMAANFVLRVNQQSRTALGSAFRQMKESLTVPPVDVSHLEPAIVENVNLITNLANDAREKLVQLYKQYGPDQSVLYKELKHMVGSRAKLISVDQNAKIFTALNTDRMTASGLETFIWDHSSAGKTPRPCHLARDGHEFSLKGSAAELYWPDGSDANQAFNGKKGDAGKPGYAIRCRCRMRPKLSLDD